MSGNVVGIVGRKEGKKQVPTNQLGNREESPPGIRSLEGVFRLPRSQKAVLASPASASLGWGGGRRLHLEPRHQTQSH